MHRWLPLGALACALLVSCARPEIIQVGIGDKVFTIEVVRSEADKERGLMYRAAMPEDHGMLFVYDRDEPLRFWMKNTKIPLSIGFLSSTGRITEIRDMRPGSLDTIESRLSCRYALELNHGAFGRAGAAEGDMVRLPVGFR